VSRSRSTSLAVAVLGSSALAVSTLGLPTHAATVPDQTKVHGTDARGGDATRRTPGYVDARQLGGTTLIRAQRTQVQGRTTADQAYFRTLGPQAVLDFDPLTHTPRNFGRLNGYLTAPSTAPARTVAMDYVRSHLSALGLTSADVSTFRFHHDYVDTLGLHNLSWSQVADGRTVFGNGLKVKVTRDGRVLDVQGSPVSGLARLATAAQHVTAHLTAARARKASARDVGGQLDSHATVASSRAGTSTSTVWSNNDFARRVWFLTPSGLRPGWSTYVQTSAGAYQHVVDAGTGRVLYRHSNTDNADGDAYVYGYYPGAPRGGKAKVVNLFKKGYLTRGQHFLRGTSVITWDDVNDDNKISKNEKAPVPGTAHKAQFKLRPFGKSVSGFCSKHYRCTWQPDKPFSWKVNRKADAVQAFYFASNYHHYLEQAPIGFTKAAGNFTTKGGDPVHLNALDGANTLRNAQGHRIGLPDGNHIDNANMDTPPDGTPPTMQMYLWHAPGANDKQEPYVPTSSAFDASVEYHEYTHGLSNRLVVDATGNSTLNDIQAGAMGEAWSDYYAMDYLVTKGFVHDTKKSGQVFEGKYLMAGRQPFRTMAIDCPVHSKANGCVSAANPKHHGGYTYSAFPKVSGGPEVHSSGEIWAQTLWDLRKALGHKVADTLITRAMSISVDDPDYLDMRNAIVQADVVAYQGRYRNQIWHIFANRGMGFFAGSTNSADTNPKNDFHMPPSAKTAHDGAVAGTVTDPTTGAPVAGALVQVTGQGGQFAAITDTHGFYEIDGLYIGTYAKVSASAPGYFGQSRRATAVRVHAFRPGVDDTNFTITRDWSAVGGGARVLDNFDGPDYTSFGCGPAQAFDTSLGTGWGSTTGDDNGDPTNVFVPKAITVQLPKAVTISTFAVDPSATCGDGASASTGDYRIETSPDGSTWTVAASGTFTSANDGHLNSVAPVAGGAGVQYVRFTMLGNQTPDFTNNCPAGAYSGCAFTDLTELAVFGS
jgi:extracellular elastinolytic metalloproteinase